MTDLLPLPWDGHDCLTQSPDLRHRTRRIPEHRVNPHRKDDVFEVLLAQIGELNLDLASDMIVGRRRDAYTAGFCDQSKWSVVEPIHETELQHKFVADRLFLP